MKSVLYAVIISILVTGLISCGGKKQTAQAPNELIKNYISKHQTMVDTSLTDLYIKNEQNNIADQINTAIATQKEAGALESLQQATFDFSEMRIKVLGEKEDYVDDEPAQFLKIAVEGNYTMSLQGSTQAIVADQTIILEKEKGAWKITETINPWG